MLLIGVKNQQTSVTNIMLNGRNIVCGAVKCVFYCQPELSNPAVAFCCL